MMQFGILSSPIQWQICHHYLWHKRHYRLIKKAEEKECFYEKE
jgi:hypothetical protein